MTVVRTTDRRAALRLPGGMALPLANLAAAAALIAAGLGLTLLALTTGATPVTLADLARPSSADAAFALAEVRLPRIVLGFMAGWCVALTGAMLQSLAQNPLADPGLLGLSQGSMLTILLLLFVAPAAPLALIPLAAMAGGLAVAAVLIALTRGGGTGTDGLALLLMGIAVETTLSPLTAMLVLYLPPETSYAVSSWMAGSLFQATPATIAALAPWCLVSLPVVAVLGRVTRVQDLGDAMALSLGAPLGWAKPAILVAAVLLSSAAVTAVGPLAFLGVMAPHLGGAISRASGRMRLVLSGLTGGVLVIAADTLTRASPTHFALPIGLSLTLIGVPLFILALRLRALSRLSPR
ncbi:FecCD family ABC transporter permease [Paracoccus sp. p4-l81]|uniref:FecCD family ABC transporter permease n=1 Tax=unclassified Paracoccus (in: a-proteobacteria) TaxID=2688777 RepID=UPI0035BA9291